MSENNQTITFRKYLEEYTTLTEPTIKSYLRAHKCTNPNKYKNARKAVKNLHKFYVNFLGNSSELESKLRRSQESNEALVQNMNELLRHCAELKEENESLNSIKLASAAKIQQLIEHEKKHYKEFADLKEQNNKAHEALERASYTNQDLRNELKSYVEQECQTLKKLEAENKELRAQLSTTRNVNNQLLEELEHANDTFNFATETQEGLHNSLIQDLENDYSEIRKERDELYEQLDAYKAKERLTLKQTLIDQDHTNQTKTGDTVDINTDKILDERTTRQKVKEQGKAETRAELKESGIELDNILPSPTLAIRAPRMILITWNSYMQTVINEDNRALEYLIENFDSIENVCYVNFETV